MFDYSLPAALKGYIREIVTDWDSAVPIGVPCSGDFSIERTVRSAGFEGEIHSNDPTFLGQAFGQYFSGEEQHRFTIEDEDFDWVSDWMTTSHDAAASAVLMLMMTEGYGSKVESPYKKRRIAAYRSQWEVMHEKQKAMIERAMPEPPITSFTAMAPELWIEQHRGMPTILLPTFYKERFVANNNPGSEIMGGPPGKLSEWTRERAHALVEQLAETHAAAWIGVTDGPASDELRPHLIGKIATTNRSQDLCIYTSSARSRLVTPNQLDEAIRMKKIMPGDRIGDVMKIHPLKYPQFCNLRSMFMNPGIRPGKPTMMFAVSVDGVLVGSFAYAIGGQSRMLNNDRNAPQPAVYLMSDFPVSGSDYGRLSKLIVYASISAEAQMALAAATGRWYRGLTTTAFSNNPVSMKYRGILNLSSRSTVEERMKKSPWAHNIKSDVNSYMRREYELNYAQALGGMTLEESLAYWKKKHGSVREAGRSSED